MSKLFDYLLAYFSLEVWRMVYGYARVSTKGQARDGNALKGRRKPCEKPGRR